MQTAKKDIQINATLFYVKHTKPDDNGKYTAVLGQLSEKAAKAVKEQLGVKVRNEPDDEKKAQFGRFVNISSKLPLPIQDAKGDEVDVLIANGTKATVQLSSYTWTDPSNAKRTGASASARQIVITELIEYNAPVDVVDESPIPLPPPLKRAKTETVDVSDEDEEVPAKTPAKPIPKTQSKSDVNTHQLKVGETYDHEEYGEVKVRKIKDDGMVQVETEDDIVLVPMDSLSINIPY